MPQSDTMTLPGDVVLAAVAHAPDAVVIVDAAGIICYWNDGATRIFGYGPQEMLGSTLDAIIPERLRQRHNEGFRAAMARGSTRYGAAELLAVPARHADGRTVSIEFSVVLLQADAARLATSQRSCATSPSAGLASMSSGGGSRRSRRAGRPDMAIPLGTTMRPRLWAGTVTGRLLVRP